MDRKKIIVNIFSNWTNLVLTMLAAFIVSPIIVHGLGNENYGIWTLVVSITGYFTVLDFGVSTALVRFISKYEALKDRKKSRQIYSNAFIFFFYVSLTIAIFTAVFAFFFGDLFEITTISKKYLYLVFLIAGLELTVSMLFSVFMGTLRAVQEFLQLNIISIIFMIIKNILLVIFLLNGYNLLSLAIIQFMTTSTRLVAQYILIKKKYHHFSYQRKDYSPQIFKDIFSYSIFSFIIAIAQKVLFYTDSIVIGSMLSVSAVTFYAIPMTLMAYLERFVYSAMSVLTPVISSNDALGDNNLNQQLYIIGTKFSLIISMPILFVLYTNGDSFISLWMGEEFGEKARNVIMIFCVGFVFSLSQIIANGILKGISKHKIFSYILVIEAICNLLLSLILIKHLGIDGVALGTTIPLVIANLIVVPMYTCRVLQLNYFQYLFESYGKMIVFTALLSLLFYKYPIKVASYFHLTLYSAATMLLFFLFSFFFILEKQQRSHIINLIKSRIHVPLLKKS